MSDDLLEAKQRRLIEEAQRAQLPDALVMAFIDLMHAYIQRVTLISAGGQVHRRPHYEDDPASYDAGAAL